MIDEEEYTEPDENIIPENIPDLETQEQMNNEAELKRIEQENAEITDGSITNNENMGTAGDAVVGGRIGELTAIEQAENAQNTNERPNTKNIRGDNPPGSEDKAFDSGITDLSSNEVKYNAENIRENFRENIDKTSAELKLDKKLKGKKKN